MHDDPHAPHRGSPRYRGQPPPGPHRPRQRPIASVATRHWRDEQTTQFPAVTPDTAAAKRVKVGKEERPSTRLREKRSRHDRRSILLMKIIVGMLAAIVLAATGTAWGMKVWYNSKFQQIAALDVHSVDIRDAPAQLGDENFLIVGSDTRAGATKEMGVGDANAVSGARSDAVMVAHVPEARDRAVLVSFPRDLEVTRPACERWDSTTGRYTGEIMPAERLVKLNTAYAVGGPRCVTKLIQQLTGMRMNHFVGIDFQGFKDMVDAVGGVTVTVDGPIIDAEVGTVATKAGPLRLDGDKALRFVRARKVEGDPTSDYGRMKRQQSFIGALLHKAMSHHVLMNPGTLTRFVDAFAAATFGENMGVDQMLTLAQSMKGMDTGTITFLTVPTTGYANDRGNEVLLRKDAGALFRALIDDTPLPGEKPEPRTQVRDSSVHEDTGGG